MARRADWEVAKWLRLAVEAVIEGSVALDRKSLGRLPLELDLIESLLDMPLLRRESGVGEPMMSSSSESDAGWTKMVGMRTDRPWILSSIGMVGEV